MRSNRTLYKGLLTFVCFAVLAAFQNCSKVNFGSDLQAMKDKLDVTGGILINGDDPYTKNTAVQLTLANDGADEMYITDAADCSSGGDWEPIAPHKSWTLSSKNSSVKVYVKYREKGVTAVESSCHNDSIVHDDIPPVVQVVKPVDAYIKAKQASLEFSANDGVGSGIKGSLCSLDGGPAQNCNNIHSVSNLTEGVRNIRIIAEDNAGNLSDPKNSSFIVDVTPPVVVFNNKPPAISNSQNVQFTYTATDSSPIKSYNCSLNGAAYANCPSPHNINLPAGSYNFSVTATDQAGNTSAPITHSFQIDNEAPTVTITKNPGQYSNSLTGLFEFVGMDGTVPITKFECSLNGTNYSSCSSPYTTPNLGTGTKTFYVRGYDAANIVSSPASYTWLIDTVAPMVTIGSQPDKETKSRAANFTFTPTDMGGSGIDKVECRMNNGAPVDCKSLSYSQSGLPDNTHKFEVRASDRAGNVGSWVSYSWIVDNVKPVLNILSGPSKPSKESNATFVMEANDPTPGSGLARIECKFTTQTDFSTCSLKQVYNSFPDGPQLFAARAVDKAGNESDIKSYDWLADRKGPDITILGPTNPLGLFDNVNIEHHVSDIGSGLALVQCGVNGVLVTCAKDRVANLGKFPSGTHKYTVYARDVLGNESTKDHLFVIENNTVVHNQNVKVSLGDNRVDILFVIDNSGSMKEEQTELANRINGFMNIVKDLDWQIALTTTDPKVNTTYGLQPSPAEAVSRPWGDGQFRDFSSNKYILKSSVDSVSSAQSLLASAISVGIRGSGDERGINAAYRALERRATAGSHQSSFFRTDAKLVVILISDEDECSTGLEECSSAKAKSTPDDMIAKVKSTFGNSKVFQYNSIIKIPGDSSCSSASNAGDVYKEISNKTGGVIGSICASNYTSILQSIGESVVELVNSANLDCAVVDANNDGKLDLSVKLQNGQVISSGFTFANGNTRVTFPDALPLGTHQITYTCVE